MSSRGALSTSGCLQRITASVTTDQGSRNGLEQELAQAFAKAHEAGIQEPLVVGAIPFNSNEPSALLVPENSQWFPAEVAREQAQQGHVETTQQPQLKEVPDQQQFISMVDAARTAMNNGEAEKVVLSRLLEARLEQPLDHRALLKRLIQQNKTGYQFDCPVSAGRRLVGSSPELLLRKQGLSFTSQPLAGSARRHPDDSPRDEQTAATLLKSTKDLYEHQVVTRSMQEVLAPYCSELNVPASPELINTPTLWHLATTITGKSSHNALSLASLLHPTPALSGFPHASAINLINALEPFERDFFGGIVGWCNEQGDGEWAIVIRSAELGEQHMRLFAGAGIVPASDPLSEWQETGTKLTTMLRALGIGSASTETA